VDHPAAPVQVDLDLALVHHCLRLALGAYSEVVEATRDEPRQQVTRAALCGGGPGFRKSEYIICRECPVGRQGLSVVVGGGSRESVCFINRHRRPRIDPHSRNVSSRTPRIDVASHQHTRDPSQIQGVLDASDPPTTLTVGDVLDQVLAPIYLRRLFGYKGSRSAAQLVSDLLAGRHNTHTRMHRKDDRPTKR